MTTGWLSLIAATCLIDLRRFRAASAHLRTAAPWLLVSEPAQEKSGAVVIAWALGAQQPQPTSPDLLDALPLIPGILDQLPLRLRHQLYQALDLQLVYKHDTSQVTYHATITTSTPQTVAAIIRDASQTTTSSDSDSGARTTPNSCHEGICGLRVSGAG